MSDKKPKKDKAKELLEQLKKDVEKGPPPAPPWPDKR